MHLPNNSDSIWVELLSGSKEVKLQFLGSKMLLSRLQMDYKKDSKSLMVLIEELKAFLIKNQKKKVVQEDILQMFS